MTGVRVALSSGDFFYVDATLDVLVNWLFEPEGVVRVGGRYVNPQQIAQLTVVDVPSVEIPETLKEEVAE